jgi:excisionase family DNA binding protein
LNPPKRIDKRKELNCDRETEPDQNRTLAIFDHIHGATIIQGDTEQHSRQRFGKDPSRSLGARRNGSHSVVPITIWAGEMVKANAVLTIGEVAELLRVHPTTIYRLIKRGAIPGFKVGGNWRISAAALDKWIAEIGLPSHNS